MIDVLVRRAVHPATAVDSALLHASSTAALLIASSETTSATLLTTLLTTLLITLDLVQSLLAFLEISREAGHDDEGADDQSSGYL